MLLIAIDAVVLIGLLKSISDEDLPFSTAFIIALIASIGTSILAFMFVSAMGLAGVFVAVGIAAALLGLTVSAICGVEIKRSFLIGAIFVVVHVVTAVGMQMMLRPNG